MRQRRSIMVRAAVAAGLAAVPLGVAGPASAQAVASAASFAVPAGPLSSALVVFGRQSGLQVSFTPEVATGKESRGVAGALAPDAALERLLAGTGLVWRWANDTTVTVYDPRSAAMTANAQGTIPLDEIQVTGTGNGTTRGETAWGPVDGYVATRSAAGSKSDTPIVEVPQSVSVVTRDQMRDRAVQSVTEALQYTPGVTTSAGGRDPRYDTVYIRGFSTLGSGGYRDGMREFDTGNFIVSRVEPYGLERIDVMRGPGSVLYGQTGPGGVIDKISKRPTAERFGEVVGTFGNFDRFQGAFDVGGAADPEGKYQFRLTGLGRDSNAQIPYFSQFIPDDRLYIAPAFAWQPTADTRWTLLSEYTHDKSGNAFPVSNATLGAGSAVVGIKALPLYLGDPSWNVFDQEQYRVASLFEHRFNDVLTVKQNMAYTSLSLDYRYLTGALYNTATTLSRTAYESIDKADAYTLDNQAHLKIVTGPLSHAMLFGFDYQRLGLDTVYSRSPGTYALNVVSPIYGIAVQPASIVQTSTDQKLYQAGLYAQDQIKFDKWLLTLGVRHDNAELDSTNRITRVETVTNDTATTKRVGLTYLFDNGVAPYASWATSFMPTTGTDYYGAAFRPTTGRQYEVGVKWQPLGSQTLVTFAAFDIVQQNVLTTDPLHTNFNVQTGEVSSRGLEFQATTTPLAGLDLIVSGSIQDVEVTQSTKGDLGKVPVLIPEQQASAWAKYTLQTGPLAGLGFGGGVRYIGPTWADLANTIQNDAQTVFDAALSYDYKGARFALNVTNLFDREQTLCTTTGGCQYISPRTVVGSVRYRW